MSTFNPLVTSYSIKSTVLVLSLLVLGACAGIKPSKNLPEQADSDVEQVETREFITTVDLARIKLGMSPLQVKSRLGAPMLSDQPQADRWDYVLKKGEGVQEEFVSYSLYFKDQKLIRLGPLSPSDASDSSDVAEPTVQPTPVQAPQASTGEILAPEPSLAVDAAVDDAAAINDMLNAWATAWAAKNIDNYLSFYTEKFEHGKKSKTEWEKQRRARLSQPGTISLNLSDVQIELKSETLAIVKFRQHYSSNRYRDSGNKLLTLVKVDDQWKIQSEEFEK